MINNKNFNLQTAIRPKLEKTNVYQATENGQYSHHPYICRFGGRYIALFSNGNIVMILKLGLTPLL